MRDRWQALASSHRRSRTLIVNFFAGPGAGKSTTAAFVFAELKTRGYTAELVPEFAKDLVWEQRHRTLEDQIYVFGKQQHRVARLIGEVDVVVTDSPIMLTPVYSRGDNALNALAAEVHNSWSTLNVRLLRDNNAHPYNERGRYQKLNEAEQVDRDVYGILCSYEIPHISVTAGPDAGTLVVERIIERLGF